MKYCSVDLELTGFDPLKDEILEIGLAFFEPQKQGLVVTEKYSQLFRPKTEVHPKILGLTGITNADLQTAPLLTDLHDEIQSKLNDCVILGHNILLDARFLEAFGFQLSGKFIDTLDLVQFILPTHHSYNLENLVHYFGIPHQQAHRALGDSLATISLLERLIKNYQAFPSELKNQITTITKDRDFLWRELLDYSLENLNRSPEQTAPPGKNIATDSLPLIEPGKFTLLSLDQTTPEITAQALQTDPSKYLLVVTDKLSVLKLWQQSLAHGLFNPADRFDAEKFSRLLQRPDLTTEQLMFCLKILVWQYTNWQTETVIDLNLSFFGSQFLSLINYQPLLAQAESKLLVCDYETFSLLADQQLYADRVPVLWTAHSLEQWLSEGSQGRLTWNKILYLLKSIYNPETNFGRQELQNEVTAALAAADLFFSLVNLELNRNFNNEQYVTYDRLQSNHFIFNKINNAAENFIKKLELVTQQNDYTELGKSINWLRNFFQPSPDRIRWIETAETNCVFIDRPLHIAQLLQKMLQPYPSSAMVENLPDQELQQYLLKRLGWSGSETLARVTNRPKPVDLHLRSEPWDHQSLVKLLQPENLPAVVIFSGKAEIRAFYDANYVELKQSANVFAQSYSGGSNKILRNFAIRPNSILLAAANFVSRSPRSLKVKTLVLTQLPKVNSSHPYIQALYQFWQSSFPNFLELQDHLELQLLFQKVSGPFLEQLQLFLPPNVDNTANQELIHNLLNA